MWRREINDAHYARLHPAEMSGTHRRDCLRALKELGYQVGAGMMVGSPGQTVDCLLDDIAFLEELRPEMIGMGPFVPAAYTPFARHAAGSVDLTLRLIALMRLRSDALVVMRPQRGCWVSRIDLSRVDDECFFRLALEKSVIERYKMFMKPSDITRLEYFIALQKEAMEAADTVGFYNADDDMHAIFFEATGLMRIWQLILRETGNHRRVRILSMGSRDVLQKNINQHEELVDALKKKDFTLAVTLETEHLSKLKYETDVIIESHPEYFINRTEEE